MTTLFRLSSIAVLALVPLGWATLSMASPPVSPTTQQAGQAHPAYLHALSDLRNARANLERRGGDAEMRWDEHRAIETIGRAITEIKAAAITDGKDLEDHPPVDEREARSGRLHKALAALRAAREDVSKEEDNAFAQGLRGRALRHIDDAIAFSEEGIGEAERGPQATSTKPDYRPNRVGDRCRTAPARACFAPMEGAWKCRYFDVARPNGVLPMTLSVEDNGYMRADAPGEHVTAAGCMECSGTYSILADGETAVDPRGTFAIDNDGSKATMDWIWCRGGNVEACLRTPQGRGHGTCERVRNR